MVNEIILENPSNKEENLSMISEVKLEFRNIDNMLLLESQKFTVPGIDASWCVEIHPVYPIARSNSRFPYAENPEKSLAPEIKLNLEFHDETIYTSNLFTAGIEIAELDRVHCFPTGKIDFITDCVVDINSKSLEFSSKSSESCAKQYNYSFGYKYDKSGRDVKFSTFILRCKLTFKFIGEFAESFTDAIKGLKNITSKSNGSLLKDGSFSDFKIIAGNESFEVHKNILANASSVFKTMFTCGLDETKLNSTTINCKSEIIQHFLRFIYEGALPSNEQLKSSNVCIDLFEIAHCYGIRILKDICKRYAMQLTVNDENALKVYEFASTYEIQLLLDSSWEIVKTKLLVIEEPCLPISLPKVKTVMAKKAELLEIFKQTKELVFKSDDEVAENTP